MRLPYVGGMLQKIRTYTAIGAKKREDRSTPYSIDTDGSIGKDNTLGTDGSFRLGSGYDDKTEKTEKRDVYGLSYDAMEYIGKHGNMRNFLKEHGEEFQRLYGYGISQNTVETAKRWYKSGKLLDIRSLRDNYGQILRQSETIDSQQLAEMYHVSERTMKKALKEIKPSYLGSDIYHVDRNTSNVLYGARMQAEEKPNRFGLMRELYSVDEKPFNVSGVSYAVNGNNTSYSPVTEHPPRFNSFRNNDRFTRLIVKKEKATPGMQAAAPEAPVKAPAPTAKPRKNGFSPPKIIYGIGAALALAAGIYSYVANQAKPDIPAPRYSQAVMHKLPAFPEDSLLKNYSVNQLLAKLEHSRDGTFVPLPLDSGDGVPQLEKADRDYISHYGLVEIEVARNGHTYKVYLSSEDLGKELEFFGNVSSKPGIIPLNTSALKSHDATWDSQNELIGIGYRFFGSRRSTLAVPEDMVIEIPFSEFESKLKAYLPLPDIPPLYRQATVIPNGELYVTVYNAGKREFEQVPFRELFNGLLKDGTVHRDAFVNKINIKTRDGEEALLYTGPKPHIDGAKGEDVVEKLPAGRVLIDFLLRELMTDGRYKSYVGFEKKKMPRDIRFENGRFVVSYYNNNTPRRIIGF